MMFELMPFDYNTSSIDKFFGDMARSFFGSGNSGLMNFKTDILDKGDKFVLQAELPGFAKEDIKLDINGEYLTISAEHKSENEETKDGYVRRERSYGSYARSFDISGIQADQIKARYNNGILELDLPKTEPAPAPAKKSIAVE